MKIFLNIIKYIFMAIFIFLCIVNLMLFSSTYIRHLSYPDIFGYTYFEVLTGSMYDYIKEQDIVLVKLNKDFEVGDVITYKSDNSYITHRVVKIDGNLVTTKGDANNTEDPVINKEQVVGVVVHVFKKASIYLNVLPDKLINVLLFLIILVITYLISVFEGREVHEN